MEIFCRIPRFSKNFISIVWYTDSSFLIHGLRLEHIYNRKQIEMIDPISDLELSTFIRVPGYILMLKKLWNLDFIYQNRELFYNYFKNYIEVRSVLKYLLIILKRNMFLILKPRKVYQVCFYY